MSIKLVLLKSGENIIADVKELVSDEKIHGYLLIDPQKLLIDQPFLFPEIEEEKVEKEIKVSMSPWILLTKDVEIVVRPDWVVTVVEPIESVLEMYKEKTTVNKNDQNSSTSK